MPPDAAMHEAQQATTDTTERLQTGGGLATQRVADHCRRSSRPARVPAPEPCSPATTCSEWREQDATKKQQQRLGEAAIRRADLDRCDRQAVHPAAQHAAGPERDLPRRHARPPGRAGWGAGNLVRPGAAKPDQTSRSMGSGRKPFGKATAGSILRAIRSRRRAPLSGWQSAGDARVRRRPNREAIAAGIDKDPNFKDATPRQKADAVEHEVRVAQGLINTPDAIDTEAHQIASYSSPPLSGYALRSPDGIKIMARVQEIDPSYSAPEYGNYSKTIGNFGSGKQGDTIRYINNAIQHIDVMQKAADALGSGDIRTFNSVANTIGREFGVPAPTTFDGLRQIVGTEIERAATGGVGAAVRPRPTDRLCWTRPTRRSSCGTSSRTSRPYSAARRTA